MRGRRAARPLDESERRRRETWMAGETRC
jgi:hypothetical protein